MDHLGISNTVDSTGAFRVAGVATFDMSTCLSFFNLVREKNTEKNNYKNFCPFFLILGICLSGYLSLQKVWTVFFYIRGKSVFSTA